jgi:hypothetical protein
MKSHRSMLYATFFVFVIAFVVIFAAKKTTLLNPKATNALNSDNLFQTTSEQSSTLSPAHENPVSTQQQVANPQFEEPVK